MFRPFGRIVECCKKWLHFGFVKFTTEEEACHAYVTLNGFRLKGRPMRLEFQNRSKKARIKAILAQAALSTPAGGGSGAAGGLISTQDQLLSMGNYGKFFLIIFINETITIYFFENLENFRKMLLNQKNNYLPQKKNICHK